MIYILLAMLLYSIATLFAVAATRHANTNLASALINTMSALIPIAVVVPTLSKKAFANQKFGLIMAICSGLLVGLFVMSINKAFAVNKVGIVTPVVFGGAIFMTTILSYFIFKEKISQLQLLGLIFFGNRPQYNYLCSCHR